jgi:hypothetical protein
LNKCNDQYSFFFQVHPQTFYLQDPNQFNAFIDTLLQNEKNQVKETYWILKPVGLSGDRTFVLEID